MAQLDWAQLMRLDPKNMGDDMDEMDADLMEVRTIFEMPLQ